MSYRLDKKQYARKHKHFHTCITKHLTLTITEKTAWIWGVKPWCKKQNALEISIYAGKYYLIKAVLKSTIATSSSTSNVKQEVKECTSRKTSHLIWSLVLLGKQLFISVGHVALFLFGYTAQRGLSKFLCVDCVHQSCQISSPVISKPFHQKASTLKICLKFSFFLCLIKWLHSS